MFFTLRQTPNQDRVYNNYLTYNRDHFFLFKKKKRIKIECKKCFRLAHVSVWNRNFKIKHKTQGHENKGKATGGRGNVWDTYCTEVWPTDAESLQQSKFTLQKKNIKIQDTGNKHWTLRIASRLRNHICISTKGLKCTGNDVTYSVEYDGPLRSA